MRKLFICFFSFLTIICCFTILCIFLTEKTDLLNLKNYRVSASFTEENGDTLLSWSRYPYPCFYQVDTYYKTTGLVEGEPEYHKVASAYTMNDTYVVPPTAILPITGLRPMASLVRFLMTRPRFPMGITGSQFVQFPLPNILPISLPV